MTKLQQLYNSIQNLKELGVQLPQELIEETNRVEEQIINNEVIPTLGNVIEPIIRQIQRELTLVIDYIPEEALQVKMTRKRSFKITEEEEAQVVEKKDFKKEISYTIAPHSKSKKTNLLISFDDGVILKNKFAYETFCQAIQKIGASNVEKLQIKQSGINIVSKSRDDFYQMHAINDGYYVLTHSSTDTKKKHLNEIAKKLNLKMKVDIVSD